MQIHWFYKYQNITWFKEKNEQCNSINDKGGKAIFKVVIEQYSSQNNAELWFCSWSFTLKLLLI